MGNDKLDLAASKKIIAKLLKQLAESKAREKKLREEAGRE